MIVGGILGKHLIGVCIYPCHELAAVLRSSNKFSTLNGIHRKSTAICGSNTVNGNSAKCIIVGKCTVILDCFRLLKFNRHLCKVQSSGFGRTSACLYLQSNRISSACSNLNRFITGSARKALLVRSRSSKLKGCLYGRIVFNGNRIGSCTAQKVQRTGSCSYGCSIRCFGFLSTGSRRIRESDLSVEIVLNITHCVKCEVFKVQNLAESKTKIAKSFNTLVALKEIRFSYRQFFNRNDDIINCEIRSILRIFVHVGYCSRNIFLTHLTSAEIFIKKLCNIRFDLF